MTPEPFVWRVRWRRVDWEPADRVARRVFTTELGAINHSERMRRSRLAAVELLVVERIDAPDSAWQTLVVRDDV